MFAASSHLLHLRELFSCFVTLNYNTRMTRRVIFSLASIEYLFLSAGVLEEHFYERVLFIWAAGALSIDTCCSTLFTAEKNAQIAPTCWSSINSFLIHSSQKCFVQYIENSCLVVLFKLPIHFLFEIRWKQVTFWCKIHNSPWPVTC